MSVICTTWAWEQVQLPSRDRMVLLALADDSNSDGVCWPSTGRLARRTGLAPRTVFRALTNLTTGGLLEVINRRGRRGRATSSMYVLHLENGRDLREIGARMYREARHQASLPREDGSWSDKHHDAAPDVTAPPADRDTLTVPRAATPEPVDNPVDNLWITLVSEIPDCHSGSLSVPGDKSVTDCSATDTLFSQPVTVSPLDPKIDPKTAGSDIEPDENTVGIETAPGEKRTKGVTRKIPGDKRAPARQTAQGALHVDPATSALQVAERPSRSIQEPAPPAKVVGLQDTDGRVGTASGALQGRALFREMRRQLERRSRGE